MIDNYEKIFVSFSGGQTSAYMALWIKENYPEKDIKYVFANTGQEHSETYRFIENIQDHYGLDVIWIESRIPKKGKASYKIVNSSTACKDGSLFDDMVNRFGIPNTGFSHCTRELKTYPMYRYIHSEWKKSTYCTAIGIRADEMDRISANYEKNAYWYPLAWSGITKKDVNLFWDKQPFKLEIPNYLGNCVWCWKKSFKKLMQVIEDDEKHFDVPILLEDKYGTCHIETQKKRFGQKQPFFRGKTWARDLIDQYKRDHLAQLSLFDIESGYENSCKESCEAIGFD